MLTIVHTYFMSDQENCTLKTTCILKLLEEQIVSIQFKIAILNNEDHFQFFFTHVQFYQTKYVALIFK